MKPFKFIVAILFCFSFHFNANASYKVYLIHGYGGLGVEMEKIGISLDQNGFDREIIFYPSFSEDIDTVASKLYKHICDEQYDTVSFVTHSMGGIIVRSMFKFPHNKPGKPCFHRLVMIAPPNKGTPVADFFVKSKLARRIGGPNIANLTTNPKTGASKYPVPDCQTGIILGVTGMSKGLNVFMNTDNDGIVIPARGKLGIEQDVAYVKAAHIDILFRENVIRMVVHFLRTGNFGRKSYSKL